MAFGSEALGRLIVMIGADTSGLDQGLGNAATKVQMFGANATASLQTFAKGMVAVGGAILAGMGAITGASVKLGADLELSLARAVATAGGGMAQFEAEARSIGRDTQLTASQAADALYLFTSAGFGVKGALEAARPAANLSIATMTDLNTAAHLLSSSLISMGADYSEAAKYSDVFATAFSRSTANVIKMDEAFKYAGPTARALGWDIQEAAASVAMFTDIGYEGGQAGTNLRTAMMQLGSPTDRAQAAFKRIGLTFDKINPQTHEFGEIIKTLAKSSLANLSTAQDIFGERAGASMLTMVKNAREGKFRYEELEAQMYKSAGAAEKMRKIMEGTVSGRWENWKSSIEEVGLSIYDLVKGPLKEFLVTMTKITNEVSAFIKEHQALVVIVGIVMTAMGAMLVVSGSLLIIIPMVTAAVALLGTSLIVTTLGITLFVGAIALLVAAVAGFAVAYHYNIGNIQEYTMMALIKMQNNILSFGMVIGGYVSEIVNFWGTAFSSGFKNGADAMARALSAMLGAFVTFATKIKDGLYNIAMAVGSAFKGDFAAASSYGSAAINSFSGAVTAAFQGASQSGEAFTTAWNNTWKDAAAVSQRSQQDVREEIIKSEEVANKAINTLKQSLATGKLTETAYDEELKKLQDQMKPPDDDDLEPPGLPPSGGGGDKKAAGLPPSGGGGDEKAGRESQWDNQIEQAQNFLAEIKNINQEFLTEDDKKYQDMKAKLTDYYNTVDEKTGQHLISHEQYVQALHDLDQWRVDELLQSVDDLDQTQIEKDLEQYDKQIAALEAYWELYKETDLINREEYEEALKAIEEKKTETIYDSLQTRYDMYGTFFNNLGELAGRWSSEEAGNTIKAIGAYTMAATKIFTFIGMVAQGEMKINAITETAKGFADLAAFNYGGAALHFAASASAVTAISEIIGVIASLPKAKEGAVILAHPNEAVVPFDKMGDAFAMWSHAGGRAEGGGMGEVNVTNYIDRIDGGNPDDIMDQIGGAVADAIKRR